MIAAGNNKQAQGNTMMEARPCEHGTQDSTWRAAVPWVSLVPAATVATVVSSYSSYTACSQ